MFDLLQIPIHLLFPAKLVMNISEHATEPTNPYCMQIHIPHARDHSWQFNGLLRHRAAKNRRRLSFGCAIRLLPTQRTMPWPDYIYHQQTPRRRRQSKTAMRTESNRARCACTFNWQRQIIQTWKSKVCVRATFVRVHASTSQEADKTRDDHMSALFNVRYGQSSRSIRAARKNMKQPGHIQNGGLHRSVCGSHSWRDVCDAMLLFDSWK